jgi:predicted acyltransferase (DUF342 family)
MSLNGRLFLYEDLSANKRMFVGGDASFGANLFIKGDVSMNGYLYANYPSSSIPSSAIAGGVTTDLYNIDISTNCRLYVNRDVSMNSRLFIGGDASFNKRVFVSSDLSVNGYLYANYPSSSIPSSAIAGGVTTDLYNIDISTNCRLYVNGDVSMNSRLFIGGDASFNKRVFVSSDLSVNGTIYANTYSNSSLLISNNINMGGVVAQFGSDISVPTTYLSNVNLSDYITQSNLNSYYSKDVNIYTRLYVDSDVSLNSNLRIKGTTASTSTTTGALIVAGGVGIAGNCIAGSLSTSSDYRIKENIIPLNGNFKVDNLNPVHYYNRLTDSSDIGFIAHEVQDEYPYLVKGEKDGNEYQSLNYNGIIGILVNEIKELKKENHTMKDELQKIKNILCNISGYNLDEK